MNSTLTDIGASTAENNHARKFSTESDCGAMSTAIAKDASTVAYMKDRALSLGHLEIEFHDLNGMYG